MKILYYFADNGTYMSKWQYEHIIDELVHHNIFIEVFNPLSYISVDEANEQLIKVLRSNSKYDLFMNCCPSTQLYKSTIKEISSLSIPTLLICFDNLHAAYIHKEIMPYFDLVWLTSWENEDIIKSWGVNTIFQPYAANPYKFIRSSSKDIDKVCFIGTPYGTRSAKINLLTSNEIPVDTYFGKMEDCGKPVLSKPQKTLIPSYYTLSNYLSTEIGRQLLYSRILAYFNKIELDTSSEFYTRFSSLSFDDMVQAYNDYALCLNVLELRNTYLLKQPVYKLHLRTFEIPMCGGIQFTTYNEELGGYFQENKEIVFYRDKEECIDKAKFYINNKNSTLREQIRIAARKRASEEHTWWSRFDTVFTVMGLKH